eukprot:gnl/TRDRNA2_/TRDRNA2_188826_c0_seq1.p1 gnl/TRDRNA2_/TRDRNA2_188826_c0~~gnl/TRDRNA2_/TRDRNA2_188826_c0_seq1.p1  ORF type:complete len:478 (+),score=65.09 gnl/TRDRNA2_/TRDRNA2_188826_c0_seq1:65-1498(+)
MEPPNAASTPKAADAKPPRLAAALQSAASPTASKASALGQSPGASSTPEARTLMAGLMAASTPKATAAAALPSSPTTGRSGAAGATGRGYLVTRLGPVGSSYFLEKQAVVIDFGSALTKVGFATESRPRHVVATPELDQRSRKAAAMSEVQWADILDRLMTKVFFHYLSTSPKDRRVVVCDQVASTMPFRRALAYVLFKRCAVPSITFVADLVLPLYLTGLNSGIVIDIGYSSSRVLATYAGVPIMSAFSVAGVGGRHVNARIRRFLQDGVPPEQRTADWLCDQEVIEDIKVQTCYVACDIPAGEQHSAGSLKLSGPVRYLRPRREEVVVPETCRWQSTEILFDGGSSHDPVEEMNIDGDHLCSSVQDAFARTIEKCPIDVRAAVVQNVVICGGCAMLQGLLPRLAMELCASLKGRKEGCLEALSSRILFTPLDFAPVSAIWAGGAVIGALDGVADYSAEDFDAGKPLPDWAREGFV